MPTLNDQLNSFKARMRNAPVLGKRTVSTALSGTSGGPSREKDGGGPERVPESDAKRVKPAMPPTPAMASGAGAHRNTQFVHALEFLKKAERAVSFEDLQGYLSSPVEPLIPMFETNPHFRVENDMVTYVSKLGIYSGDDLLRYLHGMRTFQGLPVRELKDGWSGALPTIANLEAEQKIIVVRNRKDNSPRLIWPNKGGAIGKIDQKFVSLWQSARVPSENDLPGNLEKVGLKPSSVDPRKMKRDAKQSQEKQPKRRAPRRSKITNTHMKGLLKDFS